MSAIRRGVPAFISSGLNSGWRISSARLSERPSQKNPPRGSGAAIPATVNRGANAVSARALPQADAAPGIAPQSFREVIELFERHREAILRTHLHSNVHLVSFEPGRVELRLEPAAPRDLVNRVAQKLSEWTGQTWLVGIAAAGGDATLREQDEARPHFIASSLAPISGTCSARITP